MVRTEYYAVDSINLGIGLHFANVPPFRFSAWPGRIGPDRHCFDSAFLKYETRIELNDGALSTEKKVRSAAEKSIELACAAAEKCRDGTALVDVFPPERLEGDFHRIPLNQSANLEFKDWCPDLGSLLVMLVYQSRRLDRRALAAKYLRLAKNVTHYVRPNQQEYDQVVSDLADDAA